MLLVVAPVKGGIVTSETESKETRLVGGCERSISYFSACYPEKQRAGPAAPVACRHTPLVVDATLTWSVLVITARLTLQL